MKTFSALALAATSGLSFVSSETQWSYSQDTGMAGISADGDAALLLQSSITAANSKDLLIGLSAEIELFTSTVATGTNKKGRDTSVAEAGIVAFVRYQKESAFTTATAACDGALSDDLQEALPGEVFFSTRKQELSVEVELEIVNKTSGEISDDYEIQGFVEVGLNLTTTAAHHFNFIAPLSTTYSGSDQAVVVGCFKPIDAPELSFQDGSAQAYMGVGKRMLTVQEVLGYESGR